MESLIVGVDIGTTSAIAIFDLNRNLLYLKSKRNFSMREIVNNILEFGKPLIIATDKKKVPPKINKLAASFNCKISSPDHNLTVEEKNRIINISIENTHERDALACAMFANKKYGAQFDNINKTLSSMGLEKYADKIKEMIITKEAKNIAEAIEKLEPEKEEEIIERNIDWKVKAEKLRKKLSDKKRSYDILRIYTEKLEEKIKKLELQKQLYIEEEIKKNEKIRKKILKKKEIKDRDILIKQLQFELAKLKKKKRK
ncbi:MAG: DUF460 domain-containing protein [Candidatus Aenigmatarchaeota archaeon]